jgi:HSP20 family molecular chaperone IbpA
MDYAHAIRNCDPAYGRPIPIRHNADDAFKQFDRVYHSIARRAFELFQNSGQLEGHDLDHWLAAESEFLHPVYVKLTESKGGFTLRAEVPGFTAKDLEITAEPRRIYISGKRETKTDQDGMQVRCEWRADQIFRTVDLPADVDTTHVNATVQDGLLTVGLRRDPRGNAAESSRNTIALSIWIRGRSQQAKESPHVSAYSCPSDYERIDDQSPAF